MKFNDNLASTYVFMIGIGGISMSGLAKILAKNGYKVLGSDTSINSITQELESMGIQVFHGHNENNIDNSIGIIVYSGAISHDNCEIRRAKELGIKMVERSEFLGQIAKHYSHIIAISGTHGKTTTAAMIGEIFVNAGLNPTIHLGGRSSNLGTNTLIGGDNYFIVEACEYRESFLSLYPELTVITNIECDHLDYYKDYIEIKLAFENFAKQSRTLICDSTYQIAHSDLIAIDNYSVENLEFKDGRYEYDIYFSGKLLTHIRLNMIGTHNVTNSVFATAVAHYYGISPDIISESLCNFNGVERRYQKIGYFGSISVIIDYAHHPTEIKKSVEGIKSVYKNPLVVFQPHTYSRTYKLFEKFIDVLKNIENLILFKTYPAREKEFIGGRAEDLAVELKTRILATTLDQLVDQLYIECEHKPIDCILVLGAGDLADKLKDSGIIKKYK